MVLVLPKWAMSLEQRLTHRNGRARWAGDDIHPLKPCGEGTHPVANDNHGYQSTTRDYIHNLLSVLTVCQVLIHHYGPAIPQVR
jgi:hypothetical protein